MFIWKVRESIWEVQTFIQNLQKRVTKVQTLILDLKGRDQHVQTIQMVQEVQTKQMLQTIKCLIGMGRHPNIRMEPHLDVCLGVVGEVKGF